MSEKTIVETINEGYDESCYPEEFLREFDRLECFADGHGTETFLVEEKAGHGKYIAKCYDKSIFSSVSENAILKELDHEGLPKYRAAYENSIMTVVVREYIEGVSLDRFAFDNQLDNARIVALCIELADILIYIHGRTPPVIHRDIKPRNVIVRPDGHVALIDFDISRVYSDGADTDTQFFGTRDYAPPEQYGFSQTDCRADIYSFGVLLRYLLTGSARQNPNITYYKPLMRIVNKCTGFSPKERYSDMDAVKKALLAANPRTQLIRRTLVAAISLLAAALAVFGGVKLYQYITYTPFTEGAIPAVLSDEERVADAVAFLRERFNTSFFDNTDDVATVGMIRKMLVEVYSLDEDYAYAMPGEGVPHEDENVFLPWGWPDGQYIDRDVMTYVAVKLYDPAFVADWSSLKDDNGYYPGVRVAVAFADKTGMTVGANRPADITVGDMAIILANADRLFVDFHE